MSDEQAPQRIWLQCYDDDGKYINANWEHDVTWCVDKINDDDVEYIRYEEFDAAMVKLGEQVIKTMDAEGKVRALLTDLDEVERILAAALGYPDADAVGDHTAVTLAIEAAGKLAGVGIDRVAALEAELSQVDNLLEDARRFGDPIGEMQFTHRKKWLQKQLGEL